MKKIFLSSFFLGLSACSHTINLRANHFATPIVGESQWSGHVAGVATSSTNITLVNDESLNPPDRSSIEVNKDVGPADILLLNNIGFDASLSLLSSLDLYIESSLYGLRWQFLNHGTKSDAWVAALHGAYGEKKDTNSTTTNTTSFGAESKTQTTQAGLSLGYRRGAVVPYISYIHETHKVSTQVTNSHGHFGPYSDSGVHRSLSVGLTSATKGLLLGIEYSMIDIQWDRAEKSYQNALGGRIGFAW